MLLMSVAGFGAVALGAAAGAVTAGGRDHVTIVLIGMATVTVTATAGNAAARKSPGRPSRAASFTQRLAKRD